MLIIYRNMIFNFTFCLLALWASLSIANPHHPVIEANGVVTDYLWLDQAKKPWRICALYPHLKDAYWLNVNQGMAQRVRQLQVTLRVLDAGGYNHIERQRLQLDDCLKWRADAILLGAVSDTALNDKIAQISKKVPVIALVNNIRSRDVRAKIGVDWYQMGFKSGRHLSSLHPVNSQVKHVGLILGPKSDGWSHVTLKGFLEGIKGSSLVLSQTKWGDTGHDTQLALVEDILDSGQDIDILVGSAVAIEVAVSELRLRHQEQNIQLVSYYFSPGVFIGIKLGRILAAPTDFPALQGALSINETCKILENKPFFKQLGPQIELLHQGNIERFVGEDLLLPAMYQPVYVISPQKR